MKRELRQAYHQMHKYFGHRNWWPGDTAFEICVGAILTQNTSWKNVEHAIANLVTTVRQSQRAGAGKQTTQHFHK